MSSSHTLYAEVGDQANPAKISELVYAAVNSFVRQGLDAEAEADGMKRIEYLASQKKDMKEKDLPQRWTNGITSVLASGDFQSFRVLFCYAGEQRQLAIHWDCTCDFKAAFLPVQGKEHPYAAQAESVQQTVTLSIGDWGSHIGIMDAIKDTLNREGIQIWERVSDNQPLMPVNAGPLRKNDAMNSPMI